MPVEQSFFLLLQKMNFLESFQSFDFGIIDIIDVTLVAFLLYSIYRLVKGTVAIPIFIGIVMIYLIWKVVEMLHMNMLSTILGQFINVGIFALIVVFQQEIRKFLLLIGSTRFLKNFKSLDQFKFFREAKSQLQTNCKAIVLAFQNMSKTKTGALLVIQRSNSLDFVRNSGDKMSIKVTQPILESIFFKNSPLHDGAAIIEGNYITATRVILPVSSETNIPNRFGLRHRAAIGITERTDALALVVSEETGEISYFKNGEFVFYETPEKLISLLKEDLN